MRYWRDFKSLAQWLSWCCSMTPGVAREHVRVAKALRRMPTIAGLFREGELSYSKVREVSRVVDVVDERGLAELALTGRPRRSNSGLHRPNQTRAVRNPTDHRCS
jgi:hypothetical protein